MLIEQVDVHLFSVAVISTSALGMIKSVVAAVGSVSVTPGVYLPLPPVSGNRHFVGYVVRGSGNAVNRKGNFL